MSSHVTHAVGDTTMDPVMVEILGNALISIADDALAALIRSAYSTNIKERQDCSSVILNRGGEVVTLGDVSLPGHLGSFMFTGAAILERYAPDDIQPGDVFIVNDPYSGGPSHLADVTFVSPLYASDRLVGFIGNTGHWPDVGGKAAGQCALGDATEVYQEALRIPPIRLYRQGRPQKDLLEMILLNVRDPSDRQGDIRAHVGSLRLGQQRFAELVARHGTSTIVETMDRLLDVSYAKVRAGIRSLHPGSYSATDYLDDDFGTDEPIPLRVRIDVYHEPEPRIVLDFDGSGAPARWGINSPYSSTASIVYWVLRSLLDPTAMVNAGFWRAIELHIPSPSILNPQAPSPIGARSEIMFQLPDMLFGALAQAGGDNLEAGGHGVHAIGFNGLNPPFIYYETVAGGGGARPGKDGIDGVHLASNLPIEAMEIEFPIRAECLEYVTDSGGSGRYRGGLGVRKEYRLLRDAFVSTHSNRHRVPSQGMDGGSPGGLTTIVMRTPDSEPTEVSRQASGVPAIAGSIVSIVSGGGAGIGDPFTRQPTEVVRDVLDGKVSRVGAERDYGVVMNDDAGTTLDGAATEELRRNRRQYVRPSADKSS